MGILGGEGGRHWDGYFRRGKGVDVQPIGFWLEKKKRKKPINIPSRTLCFYTFWVLGALCNLELNSK